MNRVDILNGIFVFVVSAIVAALLFGCVAMDVYVDKSMNIHNSDNAEPAYTTTSDIDGEIRQDLKDLLDVTLPVF